MRENCVVIFWLFLIQIVISCGVSRYVKAIVSELLLETMGDKL